MFDGAVAPVACDKTIPGACGGQFTTNVMVTVMELIGPAPMGTASVPQVDARKDDVSRRCGRVIMDAANRNLRPRDICTRHAFDNAIAGVAAAGGSANAVLHLLAMARGAEVPPTIDDFDAVSARTLIFVDIKPGGRFIVADVHETPVQEVVRPLSKALKPRGGPGMR